MLSIYNTKVEANYVSFQFNLKYLNECKTTIINLRDECNGNNNWGDY